ncbi:peptidyl-prolyl cis-trans isomerase [Loktanella sp. SALINAS62]|uniref:SurA N-terminal domain-containing protein n=1 Tax=Loktanella sp. SALINAS62 TaxID=2706124 RepID=UPI001B8D7718|nr:peptidyl-prolyl cis-trans isomerase [Loktanella sp. SALINAS62]MBS1301671.1 peptidylprolyl isomerase [Loktanella sp. SALINAS62]
MAKQKKSRFGVWVIMILLFVGLLGFGTGGFTGSIQRLGMAGDTEIPVSNYTTALNNQLRSLEAQVGNRVTFAQAQASGLDRQVLNQVVTTATLDNETSRLGLSIGDERVRDEVLGTQAFQSLSGAFDREVYRRALTNAGLSETEYEASLRADVARTLLQGAVVSGVDMPPVYADTLLTFMGETRDVVYAPVTLDDLQEPVSGPTARELQTFYDENPDMFTAPERREITYALLTPDMLADQITVADDQVRALYDDRIAQFQQPERRLVERLAFATPEAAAEAQASVAAGDTDFDALVDARGLSLSDVDLGDVSRDDLGAAADAVFSAAAGDVVGPVETRLGSALFRVNAVLAAEEVSFDEAAPDLRQELATDQARRVINQSAEQINDLIAGGAALEDLAERTDLELGTISMAPDTTEGPAAYDGFRTAAAAAEQGAFPELLELQDGGIFALRLDSITPPTLRPIAEVSDTLDTAWRAAAERLAIIARAEELAAEVTADSDLASLGLDPVTQQGLTRGSFVEDTPDTFMQTVFEMDTAEVRALPTADGALIVRLNAITPADLGSDRLTAQAEMLAEQVSAGLAQDLYDAFANDVRQRTDIVIDQTVVNAVNAQMQ